MDGNNTKGYFFSSKVRRKIKMEGILEGECDCSFIGGNHCLLYGDIQYAKFLQHTIRKSVPQNKYEKKKKKETEERLDYIIEKFEI